MISTSVRERESKTESEQRSREREREIVRRCERVRERVSDRVSEMKNIDHHHHHVISISIIIISQSSSSIGIAYLSWDSNDHPMDCQKSCILKVCERETEQRIRVRVS